jgi:hypothetical protein
MTSGRPDWMNVTLLKGKDATGALVTLAVDSDGNIVSTMKGDYAGALKTLSVDDGGRIIAVLRDPTNDRYLAIDADGNIVSVIKGDDSGTPRAVKVDSQGQLYALLRGLYDSTPTTIKCDENGEMHIDLKAQGLDRVSICAKKPTGTIAIAKSGNANRSTVVLHTVSAGKTLYLTAMSASIVQSVNNAIGQCTVRDESDVDQYNLIYHKSLAGEYTDAVSNSMSINYNPPIEVPAGYDIYVSTDSYGLTLSVMFSGWEE